MANWEFPGSEPIEIFIDIAVGSVVVSGEPADSTTVEVRAVDHIGPRPHGEVRVSYNAGRLEIVQPKSTGFTRGQVSLDVTVRAPARSHGTIRTATASVSCVGELAALDARTASGHVNVVSVSGTVAVNTANGDIWLEQVAGPVAARSASGDIRLGHAMGTVAVQTASGDIDIARVAEGEANVKTISGDTTIGVTPGAVVYLDL
ncbi:MAG: DUF4097 family beta strand repeat-containing protein, partial [Streptosporangiaceae bacterium]